MSSSITRPGFARLLAACAAGVLGTGTSVKAAATTHRIALHMDTSDAAIMNLALNNIANLSTYYSGAAQTAEIELVAYGPGLNMLRADTSPVKDRITSIKKSIPEVTFSVCNVTKTSMEKTEGHPIALVPEARIVPSGVVRLTELDEQGWSYIKP